MPRLVALPMRCASSGNPFQALFVWDDRRNEYVLLETIATDAGTTESPPREVLGDGGQPSTTLARLARTLGQFFKGEEPQPNPRPTDSPLLEETPEEFDLAEFNFSGFSCPLCGYGEEVPLTEGVSYVRCGKCEELVCGVRVSRARDSLTFRCRSACGSFGTLTDSGESVKARGILGKARMPSGPESSETRKSSAPAIPRPEAGPPQQSAAMSLPPPKQEG